uniref:Uncharacterized protein n=1 Tax=Tanacetum cinerariifolium TaxID=118510 RepID=A0A6L2NLE1_TANCI|nr:hypothetical protein [Tanacetum cinerariifolium]
MSTIDKNIMAIQDLYKGLNVITQLLKDINNAVKDNPTTNKKIDEAIKTVAKISTDTTKASTAWAKSSTNMAWNLGSSMAVVEISQTDLKPLSRSVTLTLALANILANVEGENATNTATEEPPSHTEGEIEDSTMAIPISSIQPTEVPPTQAQPITSITTHPESSQAAPRIDKGKRIAIESDEDPSKKLVPASTTVCLDPDEEEKVPYTINGKMCYLTDKEIQAYLDKEEKLWKAAEEARLFAMSKPKVIKVVQEEAEKIRLDPKKISSAKASKKFKKAQDAKHQVLKRKHFKKVKRLTKLNKKRAKEYLWTMTNLIKPEPITDVKIHPTPSLLYSLYIGTMIRKTLMSITHSSSQTLGSLNFDEFGPIIQKKKNLIVKDLMTSLSKRNERLKKILEELRVQSPFPALVPEQASSQTSGRKRTHMELEPVVKVPGLKCNRSLSEGVPFVNNMCVSL